jgi:dihydrofolate reductase
MKLALLAALDRARAIGRGNALPWRLPDDLQRFKALTLGQPVLMGRKTAESLGRALPGRLNLVLTRSGAVPFAGMHAVDSLDAARAQAAATAAETLWVIGGGEIYTQTLAQADLMYLTHVDTEVVGADAFFPAFEPDAWRITGYEEHGADARHAFRFEFVDYARR